MSKYLLEIGTEELPANFSKSVVTQFKSLIEFELDKKLIKYEKLLCTSTPRRIVIFIEGLVDHASDKSITRKGPKAVTAFVNGKPTKAAIGFAKSLDLDVSDLEIKKTDKGDFMNPVMLEYFYRPSTEYNLEEYPLDVDPDIYQKAFL